MDFGQHVKRCCANIGGCEYGYCVITEALCSVMEYDIVCDEFLVFIGEVLGYCSAGCDIRELVFGFGYVLVKVLH